MIRVDEIYNNTFWPWLERNRPGTRLFFCDPPGHTNAEHLFNLGSDTVKETDYVFMHDQEPVDVDLFAQLFDDVVRRTADICRPNKSCRFGHVTVSELGENIEQLCQKYEWTAHYYFYHGWACLDWFRGYDKTFLIPRASDRVPSQTFMSPNRIIGGRRDHRVLFLYHVFKNHLQHNHISAPRVCQYESVDITSIAQKYVNVYQDIVTVLDQSALPKLFAGEQQQHMHSYQLGNFSEVKDSLIYVPTETVYFGRRTHITEKTFKAIALEMPFVLVAPAGSLEYLRRYGFKTFASVLDESYDEETNDLLRVEKIAKLLKDIDNLSLRERHQLHRHMLPMVQHNYHYFYHGGFCDVLWNELQGMLNNLQTCISND
jgi:hypothetical protein